MAKKTSKKKSTEVAEIFEAIAQAEAEKGKKKPKADVPKEEPKEDALPSKVFAEIVKKAIEGEKCYVIKNLKDLPKDIQKGLKAFHNNPVTEKSTTNLKKAMKALSITTSKDASAVVMPDKPKRQAPPKFEPRTFDVGGNTLVELGRNHEPKAGDMYLVITEKKKKGKKAVKEIMVVWLLYAGIHVIYLLIPKTEDALVGTPEMLKKREVWSVDMETKERITEGADVKSGLLIPVKVAKEEKKAVNE